MKNVTWFSCGSTSAIACKLAILEDPKVEIVYIDTGSHHSDNKRFLKDCEDWYKKKITILKSQKYANVLDCIRKRKFVNSPFGASCTKFLKTEVRIKYEYENDIDTYYWGFEAGKKEENRSYRLQKRYPNFKHKFPLSEKGLTKGNCLVKLQEAGIELPAMYRLGYGNNNCICCPKGGMGYLNKIRKDFPEQFYEMAKAEREIGHSCLRNIFLDELDPDRGTIKEIIPECDIFCNSVNLEAKDIKND